MKKASKLVSLLCSEASTPLRSQRWKKSQGGVPQSQRLEVKSISNLPWHMRQLGGRKRLRTRKTLTTCRMEDVKFNAKSLLYGLEAMELMKGVSSDFSRTNQEYFRRNDRTLEYCAKH